MEQQKQLIRTPEQRQAAQERQRKRQGAPFGSFRAKLSLPSQPPEGEVWKWINNYPGELEAAQAGDWSFVAPSEAGLTGVEDRVSRFVGTDERGQALHATLMKMPKDWYEEDEKERLALPQQFENQVRRGTLERERLKQTGTGADMGYVPSVGIKMTETS